MHLVVAPLEAGVVSTPGDLRIHAIRVTLHGRRTVCGAGPLMGLVPGKFVDMETSDACPVCLAQTAPEQRHAG